MGKPSKSQQRRSKRDAARFVAMQQVLEERQKPIEDRDALSQEVARLAASLGLKRKGSTQ